MEISNSLARCDLPVPLRPVIILSPPSNVDASTCSDSPSVCPSFTGRLPPFTNRLPTRYGLMREAVREGSHEVLGVSPPSWLIVPRILHRANGVSFKASTSLDVFNGSLSSPVIFFFQAEDGIRDYKVTGVQTCALPI